MILANDTHYKCMQSDFGKLRLPQPVMRSVRAREQFMANELENEAILATRMFAGKSVALVRRHRAAEVVIEFTDGTRLFVDAAGDALELSITGDFE